MEQVFSKQLIEISDSMGLGLYQRLTMLEASLFLRISVKTVQKLIQDNKVGYVTLANSEVIFFGYMLLEYILQNISEPIKQPQPPKAAQQERILRIDEVTRMVGLSRSTIWRMERKNDFPSRVPLSSRSVGWRLIDITNWMISR